MTYEELLEKAREIYESEDTPHFFKAWLLANIIYPADESEDERIIKFIKKQLFNIKKKQLQKTMNVMQNLQRQLIGLKSKDKSRRKFQFGNIGKMELQVMEKVNKSI